MAMATAFKQRWADLGVTQRIGRATRGVLISVGALTVAGLFATRTVCKQISKRSTELPSDFVLVLDFEGSELVEKADDPVTKLRSGAIDQLQLSKIVDALYKAGTDKRVRGVVGCIGDAQKHAGLAQVQEMRNAILKFRQLKKDSVPTVAYSDSFGEGGSNGTLSYYLASAFDQIYVQETGLVSFTGFAVSQPFWRGLLDRWHVKPLAFAREEYKSIVSQYTDKEYSKANRDATEAWVNGWMGQIVHDVADARGLKPREVVRALHASPLSAPEATALGLITGSNHRSDATKTLLHSSESSAHPAGLIGSETTKVQAKSAATQKIAAAAGVAAETDAGDSKGGSSGSLAELQSVTQAVHAATHASESVALRPKAGSSSASSATRDSRTQSSEARSGAQDSASSGSDKALAVSLAQSSAADAEVPSDIASQPVPLTHPHDQQGANKAHGQAMHSKQQSQKDSSQQQSGVQDLDLVSKLRAVVKPLNMALVVQIFGEEQLKLSCVPAVSISKYIQVLEHEKKKNKGKVKPGFLQSLQSVLQDEDEKESSHQARADGQSPKPQVAVITASGIIVAGKSETTFQQKAQIASSELGLDLQKARNNPNVKAVVLRVDSPGGSAVGSDAIYKEVVRLQRAGKPVVVSMSNLAASGGYYISASADKIVAQPGTITGSIGVAFGKFNALQALRDQGINVDTVAAGKNATASSPFHDFTKEQRRQVNVMMDRTYGHFLSRVAHGRNMTLKQARAVAKGRVWTGEDALKLGLVDQLGGLKDAIQVAKQEADLSQEEDAVEVVDFPPPKPLVQLVKDLLSNNSEGFGSITAAAQLAKSAQSAVGADSLLSPFIWLALARHQGLHAAAMVPGGGDAVAQAQQQGLQMLGGGGLLTGGNYSWHGHLSGVQMLYRPVYVH